MKAKINVNSFMKRHEISIFVQKKGDSRFYEIFLKVGKKRVTFLSTLSTPSRILEEMKDLVWEEPEVRLIMSPACLDDLMLI